MTQAAAPYDVRIYGLIPTLKTQATPQTVYYDKAKNVRAEQFDGALHLYRLDDIRRINSHPAVLGTGGRGPLLSGGVPLIPLDIDGHGPQEVAAPARSDVRPEEGSATRGAGTQLSRQICSRRSCRSAGPSCIRNSVFRCRV